ncbi:MAG: hypothetical protein QOJ11_2618 [Frankiales bacterium]|jgi:hypothetical protein|nr:hypothetical protein [Frankiales bacterium]
MNTPTPVDPDKLRARLTHAVAPVKPSPDALIQIKAGVRRRRRLQWSIGSGAGVLAVAGAAAAVIAVGSLGHPSAAPRTVEPGYAPTVTATTVSPPVTTTTPRVTSAPVTSAPATATGSPTSGVAPVGPALSVTATSAPVTSSPVTTTAKGPLAPVAHDVDGDGMPDTATTQFSGGTARVVVHLAGKAVSSGAFPMGNAYGSGVVTLVDVNGDGRAELLVKAVAATGTPYYLFQYLNGALVRAPSLTGSSTDPVLFSGGGNGAGGDFGCIAGHIESTQYRVEPSTVPGALNARRYQTTVSTLTLTNGQVTGSHTSTAQGLTQQQVGTFLTQHAHDRCGAPA